MYAFKQVLFIKTTPGEGKYIFNSVAIAQMF